VANAFISQVIKQTMRIKSIVPNIIATISQKKRCSQAGFEHGSFVPKADVMSTAPRRHRQGLYQ
jgi:hypothetical protein